MDMKVYRGTKLVRNACGLTIRSTGSEARRCVGLSSLVVETQPQFPAPVKSNTDMLVRPYAEKDWYRVCHIHDAARRDELAAAGLSAAFLKLEDTAESEGFHDYEIHVGVEGDLIVGFVAFTTDELAWLYVDPRSYRRGIGTRLIRHVLQTTKGPMSAEVLVGNEAAVGAYLKQGFEIVGRDHGRMPGNESFEVSVTVLRHPGAA